MTYGMPKTSFCKNTMSWQNIFILMADYKLSSSSSKKQKTTALYLYRSIHFNQGNQIETPEINPHTHGHWILTKKPKLYIGKKNVSSKNGAGITGYLHIEE